MEDEKLKERNKLKLLYEILIDQLGEIEPYGATEIDEERFKNIDNYEYIINCLVEDLGNCIYRAHDGRYSEAVIKEKVIKYLKELKAFIEDVIPEQN